MPDPRPLTGLYGKVPAHGDFVRRALPSSFVGPWDAWLQDAVAAAREALGPRWADAWDDAPAWRFVLPPGACGPDAVAGVMLPSADTVGRRFPVTLAALLAPGQAMPGDAWFEHVEAAAIAGRAGAADADALAAAIPDPGTPPEGFPPPLAVTAWTAPAPADPAPAIPPGAPFWAATDRPTAAEGDDVLAIFAGTPGEGPATAPVAEEAWAALPDTAIPGPTAAAGPGWSGPGDAAPPPGDDPLSLLIGAAAAPTGLPGAVSDPLAMLIEQGGGEARDAIAPADPHAGLIGAGPAEAFAPLPVGEEPPDPLAALIGAGAAAAPVTDTADLLAEGPPGGASLGADPLAALIGEGAMGSPVGADPAIAAGAANPDGIAAGALPLAEPADPPGSDAAALPAPDVFAPLPLESVDAPDGPQGDVIAPGAILPPPAPPAPEGGGWWTRGAARLPAMVWPLPALPAPSDFACLLEADA